MLTQEQLSAQLRKDLTPEEREKALERGRIRYVSAGMRTPPFCCVCNLRHPKDAPHPILVLEH